MEKITLNSKVKRTNSIVTADMDGETVMMHVESGNYFGLGKVGSAIWEMTGEPIMVCDIVHCLQESYDVESERCEAETMVFLEEMTELGMIEIIEAE